VTLRCMGLLTHTGPTSFTIVTSEGIIWDHAAPELNLFDLRRSDRDMTIFRRNAIWLPRIVFMLLVVFAIDVALASTCCPLPIDSAPVESTMPDGADCPQDKDSTDHPNHNACCLSCVFMLPDSLIPESATVIQSYYSPLVYLNPASGLTPPYRPPISYPL
jgi:hypothetical protein